MSPMKKKFDPSVCRVERGDKQRKVLGFNPKLIFLHLKKKKSKTLDTKVRLSFTLTRGLIYIL